MSDSQLVEFFPDNIDATGRTNLYVSMRDRSPSWLYLVEEFREPGVWRLETRTTRPADPSEWPVRTHAVVTTLRSGLKGLRAGKAAALELVKEGKHLLASYKPERSIIVGVNKNGQRVYFSNNGGWSPVAGLASVYDDREDAEAVRSVASKRPSVVTTAVEPWKSLGMVKGNPPADDMGERLPDLRLHDGRVFQVRRTRNKYGVTYWLDGPKGSVWLGRPYTNLPNVMEFISFRDANGKSLTDKHGRGKVEAEVRNGRLQLYRPARPMPAWQLPMAERLESRNPSHDERCGACNGTGRLKFRDVASADRRQFLGRHLGGGIYTCGVCGGSGILMTYTNPRRRR